MQRKIHVGLQCSLLMRAILGYENTCTGLTGRVTATGVVGLIDYIRVSV